MDTSTSVTLGGGVGILGGGVGTLGGGIGCLEGIGCLGARPTLDDCAR
jgi:hypothetical protein